MNHLPFEEHVEVKPSVLGTVDNIVVEIEVLRVPRTTHGCYISLIVDASGRTLLQERWENVAEANILIASCALIKDVKTAIVLSGCHSRTEMYYLHFSQNGTPNLLRKNRGNMIARLVDNSF